MECSRTNPLTNMSKSPRYKCISSFSLRGSYRISYTSGERKTGINLSFRNKGKTNYWLSFPANLTTLERFDSEGRGSRCQDPTNLIQHSRALYRTDAPKVKRQRETTMS